MNHRSIRLIVIQLIVLIGTQLLGTAAYADSWNRRVATSEWTWFEDYVYMSATYLVACEPGRLCQIGMGLFAFGEPRGEKIRFSEQLEITVIGFGALHIRAADGGGPVKAAVIQKDARLIPILTWNFP